jgi:hypothetical protein
MVQWNGPTLGRMSPHELKLAVRWNKADRASRIKLIEPDTLVEPTIIEFDCISTSAPIILVDA